MVEVRGDAQRFPDAPKPVPEITHVARVSRKDMRDRKPPQPEPPPPQETLHEASWQLAELMREKLRTTGVSMLKLVEEAQVHLLEIAIVEAKLNRQQAAAILKIQRTTLVERMHRHALLAKYPPIERGGRQYQSTRAPFVAHPRTKVAY